MLLVANIFVVNEVWETLVKAMLKKFPEFWELDNMLTCIVNLKGQTSRQGLPNLLKLGTLTGREHVISLAFHGTHLRKYCPCRRVHLINLRL